MHGYPKCGLHVVEQLLLCEVRDTLNIQTTERKGVLMADTGDEKYFFNLETGQVEKGKVSAWDKRMGPYDTQEEAQHALETAQERTREWDNDDQEWENNS